LPTLVIGSTQRNQTRLTAWSAALYPLYELKPLNKPFKA
jgi:hypothetical protein